MTTNEILGIIASIILVAGAIAAEPKKKIHPAKSLKNWLLALGGLGMFTYSLLGWLQGGAVFFVYLQGLVVISSVLMMANVCEKITTGIVVAIGTGFIISSLALYQGINTVFFILGLTGIALGYILKMGTIRRSLALTLGSALIALFSYIEGDMIFFWLNVFFSFFSAIYLVLGIRSRKKRR